MNLRRLRSFVAVAEELSFRRAAVRVGISQPALSQQIRELEEELGGVALFGRDRRGVALTDAGEVLLGPACEAIAILDAAFANVRRLGSAAARTLRLGYVEYMNLPFLAPALRVLAERHPEISVEPHEAYSAAVVAGLAERRLDLGFAFLPVGHPELATRPLLVGRWMLVMPAAHPLATGEAAPAPALAGERLILFARHLNPPLHDALVAALTAGIGAEPDIAYRTAQAHLGPSLVGEGIGLFVVASYVLRALPAGLAARPISGLDGPALPLGAVWRGDGRTAAVRAFLDALDAVWDGRAGAPR